LSFSAYSLQTGPPPLLALGDKEALLLHIAQDTILDHLLAKTPEQALL
jgi:hypothetical protein